MALILDERRAIMGDIGRDLSVRHEPTALTKDEWTAVVGFADDLFDNAVIAVRNRADAKAKGELSDERILDIFARVVAKRMEVGRGVR